MVEDNFILSVLGHVVCLYYTADHNSDGELG